MGEQGRYQITPLRHCLHSTFKIPRDTMSIVGMAFKIVFITNVFSACYRNLLLQRS